MYPSCGLKCRPFYQSTIRAETAPGFRKGSSQPFAGLRRKPYPQQPGVFPLNAIGR
jgi:hypothetical protein